MPLEFEYPIDEDAPELPTPPTGLGTTMADRLLAFVRNTNFRSLISVFADRTQGLVDAGVDVSEAFDLESAVGAQLDRLGEILQRPRLTYDDDRYRTLLQIQVELVLSSGTSVPTILRIVELFTGHDPVAYSEEYPMGFTVDAVLDDPDDTPLLVQLIGEAKAAAYGATVGVSDADGLVLDYTEASEVDDDEANFILDYTEDDEVVDSGTLGYEFTT
jgi:hypothetical protein